MPHKQKASAEEKAKIVMACLAGKMGQAEAASRFQVDCSTIHSWIKQYEAEGASAFLPHEHNRIYTTELKAQAVLSYLNGEVYPKLWTV